MLTSPKLTLCITNWPMVLVNSVSRGVCNDYKHVGLLWRDLHSLREEWQTLPRETVSLASLWRRSMTIWGGSTSRGPQCLALESVCDKSTREKSISLSVVADVGSCEKRNPITPQISDHFQSVIEPKRPRQPLVEGWVWILLTLTEITLTLCGSS